MPGSIHESGEMVEWADGTGLKDIADIEAHELTALLDKVASLVGARCKALERPTQPAPAPRGFTMPAQHGGAYGRAALDTELRELRATPKGGRNDALNRAAFACFQLVEAGELDEAEVEERLWEAARATGLDDAEIRGTITSARNGAVRFPRPPRAPRDIEPRPFRYQPPEPRDGSMVDELLSDLASSQGREVGGIRVPAFPNLTASLFGLRGNCLLTGPSGLGKTTLVNTLALNVARGHDGSGFEGTEGGMHVVYFTAEMSRAEVALSMLSMLTRVKTRTLIVGESKGTKGADGLVLTEETRGTVDTMLTELRSLERTRLHVVDANPHMGPWSRAQGMHALSGLEAETLRRVPDGRCLVIIDTLAWLNPAPEMGQTHRSELDQDRDIVFGLQRMYAALDPNSCILSVHEESKAATGSGDAHSVRGSSRYMFAAGQRLNMVKADEEEGTRRMGLRHGQPDDGVTEVDLIVNKARRGGHTGDRIALRFDYMASDMREVGSFTLADIRRVKEESKAAKGGKR